MNEVSTVLMSLVINHIMFTNIYMCSVHVFASKFGFVKLNDKKR